MKNYFKDRESSKELDLDEFGTKVRTLRKLKDQIKKSRKAQRDLRDDVKSEVRDEFLWLKNLLDDKASLWKSPFDLHLSYLMRSYTDGPRDIIKLPDCRIRSVPEECYITMKYGLKIPKRQERLSILSWFRRKSSIWEFERNSLIIKTGETVRYKVNFGPLRDRIGDQEFLDFRELVSESIKMKVERFPELDDTLTKSLADIMSGYGSYLSNFEKVLEDIPEVRKKIDKAETKLARFAKQENGLLEKLKKKTKSFRILQKIRDDESVSS